MKILVTGGAGFIGSHLCEALLSLGHSVICVDNFSSSLKSNISRLIKNSQFSFVEYDVTVPGLEVGPFERLYHLASPASPNHHSPISYHALALETMLVNTQGTLNLLRLAQKNKARFLFSSTSEVYGDPLVNPQPETYLGNASTTGPRSVYDEAKRFGETLISYFVRDHNLDARIARIFNTYGPQMHPQDMRMVESFIVSALKNEPINIFGDGLQTRSLCYVTDTVDGLIKLMELDDGKGKVVNIGSEEEKTVNDFAEMIKKLCNSTSELSHTETLPQDDPKKRRADISLARKLLNWEPKVTLDVGLKQTIEYIRTL
ncbi:MAG: NAD-dependent epimerase/dehydratase family protein [Microgenomates group bacterium]|jgi:dTDP-glucose 4,6-dehydratase/UDP-glucuronate decarboxylase|nr:NAD-dependent epimerase/dehydratase family protein [Candidatus Woesebacteria bacterium]MBP6882837.1 NAD-dependent epimerase/dehydratase family protein [Candidatus Woesebacteria bacterium]HRB84924.1 GDP-mannose 4,6-dehydratase [Acinetobacter johnsonii]